MSFSNVVKYQKGPQIIVSVVTLVSFNLYVHRKINMCTALVLNMWQLHIYYNLFSLNKIFYLKKKKLF